MASMWLMYGLNMALSKIIIILDIYVIKKVIFHRICMANIWQNHLFVWLSYGKSQKRTAVVRQNL